MTRIYLHKEELRTNNYLGIDVWYHSLPGSINSGYIAFIGVKNNGVSIIDNVVLSLLFTVGSLAKRLQRFSPSPIEIFDNKRTILCLDNLEDINLGYNTGENYKNFEVVEQLAIEKRIDSSRIVGGEVLDGLARSAFLEIMPYLEDKDLIK